jgi:deazaflavin-dependent oxidoreductase (nitroreductase family)
LTAVSSMLTGMATLTNAERLQKINEYDATPPSGPLSFLGQHFGPHPWFIAFFKHFGQRVDPIMSRISGGEWMRSVYGLPGLILHTTGAKSGAPRANPVLFVRDGDDFIVVGTNFGQPKHPAWTANLKANPDAEIEVGGIRLPIRATLVEDEQWDDLYAQLIEIYPGYALYLERRGDLPPRMFRLTPQV